MDLSLSSKIVLNKVPSKLYNLEPGPESVTMTRREKIHTNIFPSSDQAAVSIADTIEREIRASQSMGRQYVMVIGTGQSLIPICEELVKRHKENGLSFNNVVVFNAYQAFPLGAEGNFNSLTQLNKRLLDHVDIRRENVHSFEGNTDDVRSICTATDNLIHSLGGIDTVLLGTGRTGNIAANVAGSPHASVSRVVLLDEVSREEMASTFDGKDTMPNCAITLGIATLMSARTIFLTTWGEEKADIIQRMVEEPVSDLIPASVLQLHPNAHVVVDLGAAAKLTRIERPWLVTSCEWNDKLLRSALVWLCLKTGKPILKLTNRDYSENGLSDLLVIYGSAYNANIKIFNDLQHTITGWPGGKPGADDTYRPERALPFPKRVVVFSPHPDDDVISMGGTINRLVNQGHEVHVAYETSGNIAVGDEEVTRFMHFINGFRELFGVDADKESSIISDKYYEIKDFFAKKHDGDPDTRDILTIKGLIRRGEARTACTYNKIPLSRVHFLDLPFYESGRIEKLPMSEKDVVIVKRLLDEVQPHQIYIAGDLADPHGTHRKCTDAVLAALDLAREEGAKWLDDCRVWMYRGAWAEWEIENIEMCVPMSPEELRTKRNSILKHSSQMENAPFLGNDERLFWQRAEDRNRGTARLYDQLGLASYEAMEAFVEYKLPPKA